MFRVVTYACFIYVWDQHNLHCRENFTKFVNVLFVLAWKAQYVSVAAGATALVSLLLGEQVELLDIDIGTHTCVSCWCINESETAEFKCFNRGLKAIWEWMLSTGFHVLVCGYVQFVVFCSLQVCNCRFTMCVACSFLKLSAWIRTKV